MNAQDAMTLLSKLGCVSIRVDSSNQWVKSSCPLAAWKHVGGSDKHPSFGVSIHPDGESKFHCFVCGMDGSLTNLLWRIGSETKTDLSSLNAWVTSKNVPALSALQQKSQNIVIGWKGAVSTSADGFALTSTSFSKLETAPPPLTEAELDRFQTPTPEVLEYLLTPSEQLTSFGEKGRGLTQETVERWELRWHEDARRIAIPIRSKEGQLVGISGRAFDKQRPKFLHSTGFRKDFYLYGEQFCRKGEPGYLTEGFFDVMFLHQKGINAFAIMGSHISQVQMEKCASLFSRIVVVPDGDAPGAEAATKLQERLGARMKLVVFPTPEGKDPDNLSEEELTALRAL